MTASRVHHHDDSHADHRDPEEDLAERLKEYAHRSRTSFKAALQHAAPPRADCPGDDALDATPTSPWSRTRAASGPESIRQS